MEGSIIQQGTELMVFGMGTVVLFLSLLVLATGLMSRLVTRYFPEEQAPAITTGNGDGSAAPLRDARLTAVISAAIHRHRSRGNQVTRDGRR